MDDHKLHAVLQAVEAGTEAQDLGATKHEAAALLAAAAKRGFIAWEKSCGSYVLTAAGRRRLSGTADGAPRKRLLSARLIGVGVATAGFGAIVVAAAWPWADAMPRPPNEDAPEAAVASEPSRSAAPQPTAAAVAKSTPLAAQPAAPPGAPTVTAAAVAALGSPTGVSASLPVSTASQGAPEPAEPRPAQTNATAPSDPPAVAAPPDAADSAAATGAPAPAVALAAPSGAPAGSNDATAADAAQPSPRHTRHSRHAVRPPRQRTGFFADFDRFTRRIFSAPSWSGTGSRNNGRN